MTGVIDALCLLVNLGHSAVYAFFFMRKCSLILASVVRLLPAREGFVLCCLSVSLWLRLRRSRSSQGEGGARKPVDQIRDRTASATGAGKRWTLRWVTRIVSGDWTDNICWHRGGRLGGEGENRVACRSGSGQNNCGSWFRKRSPCSVARSCILSFASRSCRRACSNTGCNAFSNSPVRAWYRSAGMPSDRRKAFITNSSGSSAAGSCSL